MFEINKKENYYVLTRDNTYFEFKSYEGLLEWLRRRSIYWRSKETHGKIDRIGNNWNDTCTVPTGAWPHLYSERQGVDYIVFDAYNRVVNVEDLIKDLDNLPEKTYGSYRRRLWFRYRNNWLGFRNGPVPGVRKWRGGSGYRCMRTTQELRRNSWDKKYARKRRCRKYLPNSWDDVSSGKWDCNRSWKKQKKRKQWM